MTKKIGFIGTGNMGSAMIGGLINRKTARADQILVSDRNRASLDRVATVWPGVQCSASNSEIAVKADILVLAVKPHIYKPVIEEIAPHINSGQIIITIAAGVTISQAEEMFAKKVKIIRTMPNTPAMVGEGVTAYCCNSSISREDEEEILPLLESFGIVEKIDEESFHSVIALSGSSPAYVFMFIEAMADGAVLQGMSREQAYRMASQAVLGAAKMVRDSGTHPGMLKDSVCSPGGTTIEAVRALESKGLRSAVIEAMDKCAVRSKEMTKG